MSHATPDNHGRIATRGSKEYCGEITYRVGDVLTTFVLRMELDDRMRSNGGQEEAEGGAT